MGAGADGPGEFTDGDDVADAFQTFERAPKFIIHEREFEPKSGGLGLDTVAPANAGGELVFFGAFGDGEAGGFDIGNQQIGALLHLNRVAGIADVAAGEAKMEPAAGLVVDLFRHGGGETDDVVIQDFFQFTLAGDQAGQIGQPGFATGFEFGKVGGGDDALFDEGFAGEQFDLQPDAQFIFIGPNGPHFGA